MPNWFSFPFIIVVGDGAGFGTAAYKLIGSESLGILIAGIFMFIIDAVMRMGSNPLRPAIDPEPGGYPHFIPGWVFGIIVTIGGVYSMISGSSCMRKSVQNRESLLPETQSIVLGFG